MRTASIWVSAGPWRRGSIAEGTMRFDILPFRCRYAQLSTVIKANILRIIDDSSHLPTRGTSVPGATGP